MTPKGKAFVEHMDMVDEFARTGIPIFAAMASGLTDEDWILVYVAARKLAKEVREQELVTS